MMLHRLIWFACLFVCCAMIAAGNAQSPLHLLGAGAGAASGAAPARSFVTASTPKQYITTTWSHAPTDATRATISYWINYNVSPTGTIYMVTTAANSSILFNHQYVAASFRHRVTDDIVTAYDVAGFGIAPDTGTWHHVCVQIDTNQATSTNRIRIYVDGTEVSYGTQTEPTLALNMQVTANAIASYIGEVSYQIGASTGIPDAKFAYVYVIDGQNPTPDYTAFTTGSAGVGNIHPKTYTGAFGNNGTFLNGSGNSTTVNDQSGQGNNWTAPNNITYDADLPT